MNLEQKVNELEKRVSQLEKQVAEATTTFSFDEKIVSEILNGRPKRKRGSC